MSQLGNSLKTLIDNFLDSKKITDIFVGTMVSDTQFRIDGSEGPIPESLTFMLEHNYERPIQAGDKVLVLRKTGGQQFFIMGRLL